MAPARNIVWGIVVRYFEVLGPKVASSSYNSHPRLLFRIAGCNHKGRQKQTKITMLMNPWLQIHIAGCDHKGRQEQPKIVILMHSRLQIRIAGCDHRGSQQQLKIQIRKAKGRQQSQKTAKQNGEVDSVVGGGREPLAVV